MKKNWKVWVLYDKNGNKLAEGRKKDVLDVEYQRYVYAHIFTDTLYTREDTTLEKWLEARKA